MNIFLKSFLYIVTIGLSGFLVIFGQAQTGLYGLGLMLMGLAGLICILGVYNAKHQ